MNNRKKKKHLPKKILYICKNCTHRHRQTHTHTRVQTKLFPIKIKRIWFSLTRT